MKIRNLLMSSYLLAASLVPFPASAAVVCENGICTETFNFTGSAQSWLVPDGVTQISFKVYGASGGRGGAGGEVTGELTGLPATLYLYVGGQGTEGNNAPGGFNGGGATTGNRGNEGSGGGASDIRFGAALTDRVVVAGGGGGSGGRSGGRGGNGGALLGASGESGQGGGGGGGSQTAGGPAGTSNGGTPGTNGSFGLGGEGGFSWNAGGGGGGGGWYGGGGGGPDNNTCCSDGGGGGGGSSYARSDLTSNVKHQAGVNTGNGRIEISYQQAITIISFSGQQESSTIAKFTLVMSSNIYGLEAEDFTASQTCQLSQVIVEGESASVELLNCSHGEVALTLKSASVGPSPSVDVSVGIQFDKQPPEFSWGESPSAIANSALTNSFSLSEGQLSLAQLDTGRCNAAIQEEQLLLEACPEGLNTISVLPGSLVDQWGNVGPLEVISFFFLVDLTSPDAVWSEVEITQSESFRYAALLTLSEPSTFEPSKVEFSSDSECITGYEAEGLSWRFYADCNYATGSWRLPEFSLVDEVGNSGPSAERIATFVNAAPVVDPEPVQPDPVSPDLEDPEPNDPEPTDPEPQQPEPTEPPAGDAKPMPLPLPIATPVEAPDAEGENEIPTESSPEVILEKPTLIEAAPITESEQFNKPQPHQPSVQPELEGASDEPLLETENTQLQFEAEPIVVETSEPAPSPIPILLVLLGAVLSIGFIGWRIIGR